MARYALILAAFTGFILSAVSGIVIVPFLHKLHFGQTIKEIGPTWHNKKQGTPTMGGLCFIFASTVAVALATLSLLHSAPEMLGGPTARSLYIAMFSAFAFGMVGFLDDFIKVVKKRNLGLRAMQKIVAQLLITTALLFALHMNGTLTTFVTLPGLGYVDLGLLYYPLSYGLIIGIVNAVNLTDGIDGLAAGVTFVVMVFFAAVGVLWEDHGIRALFPAAMAGGLAAFFVYNHHPAKVFMGDTGSLFLGGAVAALAFAFDMPLVLIPVGIIYILETLSDIIQVGYFKLTHGKRFFKMAPLHHHLELSGWSEAKLVAVFSLVTAAGCVLALLGIQGRY